MDVSSVSIFLPHTILTSDSGYLLGFVDKTKCRIYITGFSKDWNNLQNTENGSVDGDRSCVIRNIGLWITDTEYEKCFSMPDSDKILTLQKTEDLPECELYGDFKQYQELIVVLYDNVKLQEAPLLTERITESKVHTLTNIEELCNGICSQHKPHGHKGTVSSILFKILAVLIKFCWLMCKPFQR